MGSKSDLALSPTVVLRVQYATYLFLGLVGTMVLRGTLGRILSYVPMIKKGCEYAGGGDANFCTGEVLAYRVSFSLALFFFFHLLSVSDLTCCIDAESRVEFQKRFFFAKTILLGLVFAATLSIPNTFFAYYAYACIFASGLFLLINVVFLVDFSYRWSDEWTSRMEQHGKWMFYLIATTLMGYAAGIIISIFSFVYFVPHSDCNYNAFAILSVLISAVVYTVLSIWVPHGSVLPSAIVFAYSSGVMFTTLRLENDSYCNTISVPPEQAGSMKQMLLGSLVSGFTLFYSVVSTGGNGGLSSTADDEEEGDPDTTGNLSSYMFFYATMVLGSMYLAMLSTGWHVSGRSEGVVEDSINIAYWVRSGTVWSSVLLYVWSLLAPYYCCRDRDFGFNTDDW
uniref:Uncharacterized protein TCIL3000_11_7020 n=1 Tax=Trypanosoma congolense (strain IL3000) TaxID=1068625 RepID=G0V0V3_TRYCI|nr:unnamed protein product [Trypanosoma congolense IL3000]